MMRSLLIGLLGAAVLAACATTPGARASHATAASVPPGWCSTASGKPLRPGSSGCDSLTRTYSGEQLRRTGMTDAAHALGMLDPEVTVRGQ